MLGENSVIYLFIPIGYAVLGSSLLLLAIVLACFPKSRKLAKATFFGVVLSFPGFMLGFMLSCLFIAWLNHLDPNRYYDLPFFFLYVPFVIALTCVVLGFYFGTRLGLEKPFLPKSWPGFRNFWAGLLKGQ